MIADFGLARSIEKASSKKVSFTLFLLAVLAHEFPTGIHRLRRDPMVSTSRAATWRIQVSYSG